MSEVVNIPAKITWASISTQWKDKQVRLVIDTNGMGEAYWGIPTMFSQEIKETKKMDSISIIFNSAKKCAINSLEFKEEGSFLNKEYFLQLHTYQYISFKVSKRDGQKFFDTYKKYINDVEKSKVLSKEYQSDCDSLIVKKLKVSGKINLHEFSKKVTPKLEKILLKHYPEDLTALTSPETKESYYFDFVKKWVEDSIDCDDLSGIINENDEYVDRDLIVKEQKITQVNIQMDFNSLLQQLGNKGVMVSSIQCPQCKAACTIPHTGAIFNCESCGTQIKVTDVFDKFKGILG